MNRITQQGREGVTRQIKRICQMYGIEPKRERGQHFLINAAVIETMLGAAAIGPDETVLEVGPGLGILTEALIAKARTVISVELDRTLLGFLRAQFAGSKNLELIGDDVLHFHRTSAGNRLSDHQYLVVANLPYNITAHFIKIFLTVEPKPSRMVLLLQKEVAERLVADSGEMSLLSLSAQLYSSPAIIEVVRRTNFWPEPAVDSAVVLFSSIRDRSALKHVLGDVSEKQFWQIARIGFSARRKMLANNLSAGLRVPAITLREQLSGLGIDPHGRPQDLTLSQWITLAKNLKSYLN